MIRTIEQLAREVTLTARGLMGYQGNKNEEVRLQLRRYHKWAYEMLKRTKDEARYFQIREVIDIAGGYLSSLFRDSVSSKFVAPPRDD